MNSATTIPKTSMLKHQRFKQQRTKKRKGFSPLSSHVWSYSKLLYVVQNAAGELEKLNLHHYQCTQACDFQNQTLKIQFGFYTEKNIQIAQQVAEERRLACICVCRM